MKSFTLICLMCLIFNTGMLAQITLAPTEHEGFSYNEKVANGWTTASPQNDKYEIRTTNGDRLGGESVNYIKSKEDHINGTGAVYRCIALEPYRGKRVRMTGWAKTINATDPEGAGFWFFGTWDGESVLDNAVIKGTTDWTKYSMVINISQYAYMITCGVEIHGTGEIWFRDIRFEVVDNTVPVTAVAKKKK